MAPFGRTTGKGFLLGQNLTSVLFVIPKGDWKLSQGNRFEGRLEAEVCPGPLGLHSRESSFPGAGSPFLPGRRSLTVRYAGLSEDGHEEIEEDFERPGQ